MNFTETWAGHVRITILRLLAKEPDYALNESILADLIEPFRFALSRDQLRTTLAWLADQGLVSTVDVSGLAIATLTERGLDAAEGKLEVPGVKKPSPRGG